MKATRGILALALIFAGISLAASGCVFVPVRPDYAYRPAVVAPVVVAPAPVVVVRRPYAYWW